MLPMFFSNKYPYTSFHELNLDWILAQIKQLEIELNNFVGINTIKYADPIQWDITRQYEANTIVIEPNTGTAYISTHAVPSGVAITNTDYWTVVFSLDINSSNENITLRNDGNNTNATFPSVEGDWVIVSGVLYKVNSTIDIGDTYVPNYNILRYTVELFITDYISNLVAQIGTLSDLTTTDKTTLVNAINEVCGMIGTLSDLTTVDKTNLVNAINEIVGAVTTLAGDVGDLTNLTTTDKSDLVNAINEVNANVGDLNNLTTPDKSSIVNAINSKLTFKVATDVQYVIYLDGTSGDDDNDGLTMATPVKTLDKALSFLNSYANALRIEFLTTNTYVCTPTVISGCFVHFKALAPNIVVNFNNSQDITFYDSDFLVLDTPSVPGNNFIFNGHRILTVNAHFEVYDTEFNIGFHLEGTNGQFTRCKFNKNHLLTDSYGLIVNCTMNMSSNETENFTAQHNSHLEIRGTVSYGSDYYQQYYGFYVNDSEAVCNANFTSDTAPHNFRLERSKLVSALSNMPTFLMVGANEIETDMQISITAEASTPNITLGGSGCNRIGNSTYLYHLNFSATGTVTTQKIGTLANAPIIAMFFPVCSSSGDDGFVEINTSGEIIVHNITTTGSKHAQGLVRLFNPDHT